MKLHIYTSVYLHSRKNPETGAHERGKAEILRHRNNNDVLAWVPTDDEGKSGVFCTGVYNLFSGAFFIDDVYGVLEKDEALARYPEIADVINHTAGDV